MKIKELKLFQSVKCGSKEVTFATHKDFLITLDINTTIITIESKIEKVKVYTSLYNAPWFTELTPVEKGSSGQEESPKNTERTRQKKPKPTKVARPKVFKTE